MSILQRSDNLVLVLDFGSQYTHLITRRIRGLHITSVCLAAGTPLASIQALKPAVIILSGGPHSVHLDGAPTLPEGFFAYVKENGIRVLGICYGLHLIVKLLGGEVKPAERQEYGRMQISAVEGSRLYGDLAGVVSNQTVWMSHGDEAVRLPDGFKVVATSVQGNIAAIENAEANIFALQYHPEV
jgi:GMP synthase (glutamine-hydrolysing)